MRGVLPTRAYHLRAEDDKEFYVVIPTRKGNDGPIGANLLSHTALKRPARLDEIVAAVLFLADPENTYTTGHVVNVDGGFAAGYARNF